MQMTTHSNHEPEFEIMVKMDKSATWEHCDYATDRSDLRYLLHEYRVAFGPEPKLKTVKC